MRYAFAGDRQISCNLLKYIIQQGYAPQALLVTTGENASHNEQLKEISGLDPEYIFEGLDFKEPDSIQRLRDLQLDYIIGVHYPYIIPKEVLDIPTVGFLNLHPAYLPYNKGWNTPSWAILDGTVYGATLHFMTEELDKGDIIHQKEVKIKQDDTANSLYQRVLAAEEETFKEAFQDLLSLNPPRKKQHDPGTTYKKSDLEKIRKVDLDDKVVVKDFLDKVRALTTNNPDEMVYFKDAGKKIGVKVEFVRLNP